jgi:hypothetical protein
MSKMWKGPTPLLRAAHSSPLWAAIHRRNGRLGVFCDSDTTGQALSAFAIRKGRDGEWYRHELGAVESDTPLSAALKLSHEFTPYDADLVSLHHAYIESLAEDVVIDGKALVKRIDAVTEDLQDALNLVRA